MPPVTGTKFENRHGRIFVDSICNQRPTCQPSENTVLTPYTLTPTPTTAFLLQQRNEARKLLNGGGIPRMASFERDPLVVQISRPVARQLSYHEERVLEHGTNTNLPWQRPYDQDLPKTIYREQDSWRRSLSKDTAARQSISRQSLISGNASSISPESDVHDSPTNLNGPLYGSNHRDGYSEDKCRYVLVTQCARIARQYDYAQGVKRVYPILREYVGDENLDLVSGVLTEMIEIPVNYQWEEGGIFQRWKYAHRRRDDFAHLSTPALGNVIVGTMIPTEPLRRHRLHNTVLHTESTPVPSTLSTPPISPASLVSSASPELLSVAWCDETASHSYSGILSGMLSVPATSIRSQKAWQIDYSCFVSSPSRGTSIHIKPPTPADLHLMIWDASFGRGGRFVEHRQITIPETSDRRDLVIENSAATKKRAWSSRAKRSLDRIIAVAMSQVSCSSRPPQSFTPRIASSTIIKKTNRGLIWPKTECPCDTSGHSSVDVQIYEKRLAVKTLPDPSSVEGRRFYSTIHNQPLPEGFVIPTEGFVRKNELVPSSADLPAATFVTTHLPLAEDLAIRRYQQAAIHAANLQHPVDMNGPFTNELFKDGGMDYHWETSDTQPMVDKSQDIKNVRWESPLAKSPGLENDSLNGRQIKRPHTPLDFAKLGGSRCSVDEQDCTKNVPDDVLSAHGSVLSSSGHGELSCVGTKISQGVSFETTDDSSCSNTGTSKNSTASINATYVPRLRGGLGSLGWDSDNGSFSDHEADAPYIGDLDHEETMMERFPDCVDDQCLDLNDDSQQKCTRQDDFEVKTKFWYVRSSRGILVRQSINHQILITEPRFSMKRMPKRLTKCGTVVSDTQSLTTTSQQSRYSASIGPGYHVQRPFASNQDPKIVTNDSEEQFASDPPPTKTIKTLKNPFLATHTRSPTQLAVEYTDSLRLRHSKAESRQAAPVLKVYDRIVSDSAQKTAGNHILRSNKQIINRLKSYKTTRRLLLSNRMYGLGAGAAQMDPYDSEAEERFPVEYQAWKREQAAEAEHDDHSARLEGYSGFDDDQLDTNVASMRPQISTLERRISSLQSHTQRTTPRMSSGTFGNVSSHTPNFSRHRTSLDIASHRSPIFSPQGQVRREGISLSSEIDPLRQERQHPIRTSSIGAVGRAYTTPGNVSIELDPFAAISEDDAVHGSNEPDLSVTYTTPIQHSKTVTSSGDAQSNVRPYTAQLMLQPSRQFSSKNYTQRYSQENEQELSRPDANHGVIRSSLNDLADTSTASLDTDERLLPITYRVPVAEHTAIRSMSSSTRDNLPVVSGTKASSIDTYPTLPNGINVGTTHTLTSVKSLQTFRQHTDLAYTANVTLTDKTPVLGTDTALPAISRGDKLIASLESSQLSGQVPHTNLYSYAGEFSASDDIVIGVNDPHRDHVGSPLTSIKQLMKRVTSKSRLFLRNNIHKSKLSTPQSLMVQGIKACVSTSMDAQAQYNLRGFLQHSIQNAAGVLLSLEFLNRRISTTTLAPIEKEWKKHNGTTPSHFYYSIEYQYRIIKVHIDTLRFKGGYSYSNVVAIVAELGQLAAILGDITFGYCADDNCINELLRMAIRVLCILGASPDVLTRVSIFKSNHDDNVMAAINRKIINEAATPGIDGSFGLTPALQPFATGRYVITGFDYVTDFDASSGRGVTHHATSISSLYNTPNLDLRDHQDL